MKLYRNGGDVRGANDELVYEPNVAEKVAMATGFTPRKVSDMRELNKLSRQFEDTRRNAMSNFYDKVADKLISKDFQGARKLLLTKAAEMPHEFDPAEGATAAVARMQEKTLPEDVLRGGSRLSMHDRTDLQKSYELKGPPPSELARFMQATQMRNALGFGKPLNMAAYQSAQQVDQLMGQNPSLTRVQARMIVQQQNKNKYN